MYNKTTKESIFCRRTIALALLLLLLAACGGTGDATVEATALPADAPAETQPAAPATAAAATTSAPTGHAIPIELESRSLGNMLYQGVPDKDVTLVDGKFEGEPDVAGSASRPQVTLLPEPIAYGDLNGDGQTDAAVILASNFGGSGTFIYLAAVESRSGTPVNVATTPLGDREQVKSIVIDNDQLIMTLLSHAESDPACCPTLETTRTFRLLDGEWAETRD